MSYLNRAQDPRRRTTAVAGVVAVHAAIGYVLVTGLAYQGFTTIKDRFEGVIITPETPPPPPEPAAVVPDTPKLPDFVAPTPPLDLTPVTPVQVQKFDPLVIPDAVAVPRPTDLVTPQPRPQPSFAPKSAAPRGDTSRWVTTQDYPAVSLRRGSEGTTHFRVVVGTDGRVDACEVTRSSGDAQLDAAACKNVERRARFEPATDGSGQRVVGTYTSRVTWQIPD